MRHEGHEEHEEKARKDCADWRCIPSNSVGTAVLEKNRRHFARGLGTGRKTFQPIALMMALAISMVPTAVGSSRWGFMS